MSSSPIVSSRDGPDSKLSILTSSSISPNYEATNATHIKHSHSVSISSSSSSSSLSSIAKYKAQQTAVLTEYPVSGDDDFDITPHNKSSTITTTNAINAKGGVTTTTDVNNNGYVSGSDIIDVSSPENQAALDKIYRKLDLRIIPPLWCLYFLTSMGSSLYGNALTMNMESKDSLRQKLALSAHDTSTASALYYVGYIVFDVPMNLLMTRLAPQTWLSRIVMSVGIVYICYTALTNAGGVIAIRLISGLCGAGTWPGMAYYVSLWYPAHRTARRIGYYFTAAQVSASVAGLIAAGFQKMNRDGGLVGWQWMFLLYGIVTFLVGISLIWWLPDRPAPLRQSMNQSSSENEKRNVIFRLFDKMTPEQHFSILTPEEQALHQADMHGRYLNVAWGLRDLWRVFLDLRMWPLVLMYFGVVGTGYGIVVFGTTILKTIDKTWSSVTLSLLMAPIWMCDLCGILLVTPFSDRFRNWRGTVFSASTVVIIVGMVVTTYAPRQWPRYGGLLITGFGLGPTVPVCMTWAAEIFGPRHGDVGTAASAALVSGLGNLGSVTTTYALYTGWPSDVARGFEYSNMVVVAILGMSILSAGLCAVVTGSFPLFAVLRSLRGIKSQQPITTSTINDSSITEGGIGSETITTTNNNNNIKKTEK